MKQKRQCSIRSLWRGAMVPLLGALALVLGFALHANAQINPARILYYQDFQGGDWGTANSEVTLFAKSGPADQVATKDSVLLNSGVGAANRLNYNGGASAKSDACAKLLNPAPTKGMIMFISNTTDKAKAAWLQPLKVLNNPQEVVVYTSVGSSGAVRVVFEFIDAVADTVIEASETLNGASASACTYKISYELKNKAIGNVKLRAKVFADATGKNAYFHELWVLSAPIPATAVNITSTKSARILEGDTCTLTAALTPANAEPFISWSLATAADSAMATITAVPNTLSAIVQGNARGMVKVVATSGSITKTFSVAVTPKPLSNPGRILDQYHFDVEGSGWILVPEKDDDIIANNKPNTTSLVDRVTVFSGSRGDRIRHEKAGPAGNSKSWIPAATSRSFMMVSRSANYDGATDSAKILTCGGFYLPPVNPADLNEVVAYFKGPSATNYISFSVEIVDTTTKATLALIRDETAVANNENEVRGSYIVPAWVRSHGGAVWVKVRGHRVNTDGSVPATAGGLNIWLHDVFLLKDHIPATAISLNASKATVLFSDTCKITATLTPATAEPFMMEWSLATAADSALATITAIDSLIPRAILTAKTTEGTVKVVAKTFGGVSNTIDIAISAPQPDSVILSTPYQKIALADTVVISAKIYPNLDAVDKTVVWSFVNPAHAANANIDSIAPNVAAFKFNTAGSYEVIATTTNGHSDTISMNVLSTVLVDSIKIAGYKVSYGRTQLTATVFPGNASINKLRWSSSVPTIATVDSTGKVLVVSEGSVVITAAATDASTKVGTHALRASFTYVDSLNGPDAAAGKTLWSSNTSETVLSFSEWDNMLLPGDNSLKLMQGTSSSNRRAICTFENPVFFNSKLNVEFDWWIYQPFSTANGNEGQISLRDVDDNDIVTLYLRGNDRTSGKGIYVAAGQIPRNTIDPGWKENEIWDSRTSQGAITYSKSSNNPYNSGYDYYMGNSEYFAYVQAPGDTLWMRQGVLPENRDITTFAELPIAVPSGELGSNHPFVGAGGTYYHVKIEAYTTPGSKMVRVNLTDEAGVSYISEVAAPDDFNPSSFANLFVNMIRRGSNLTAWQLRFDNFKVQSADAMLVYPTSVAIAKQYPALNVGGTNVLTASVAPYDVDNKNVTWSFADAADAANYEITPIADVVGKATLTSKGTAGFVKVVATSVMNTVADTIQVECKVVKIDSVVLSGPDEISINNEIPFTAAIYPGNADNQVLAWTTSDNNVATVTPAGIVTGIAEGTVGISVATTDGTSITKSKVVESKTQVIKRIDLQGARRLFFGKPFASWAPFTINAITTPENASFKTLQWSSSDESVATVTPTGTVTLTGNGKAAIKVAATDGSGAEEFYYIEVAETSPYNGYADFEDGKYGIFREVSRTAGLDTTTSGVKTLQESKVLKVDAVYPSGYTGTGPRFGIMALDSAIVGNVIYLNFDWYPHISSNGNLTEQATLSVRADSSSATGISHDANTPWTVDNNLLTLSYKRIGGDTVYFGYHVGNYQFNTLWPEGTELANLTALDMWYTVNLTVNKLTKSMSFSITERGNHDKGHFIDEISLDGIIGDGFEGRIKSFLACGFRSAGNNDMMQSIDNITYKIKDDIVLVNVTFDPNGGKFSDNSTSNKVLEVEEGTTFGNRVPTTSRDHHTFMGWGLDGVNYDAEALSTFTTLTPVTFVAAWKIDSFQVVLKNGNAQYGDIQVINYGGKVEKPATDPTRTGYTFVEWRKGTAKWNFDTDVVTGNLTLEAYFVLGGTGVPSEALQPLNVYPNPVIDEFSIDNSDLKAGEKIQIYSIKGALLNTYEVVGGDYTVCNIAHLPQGTYFVKVSNKMAKLVKK